jgi:hypothetical protein
MQHTVARWAAGHSERRHTAQDHCGPPWRTGRRPPTSGAVAPWRPTSRGARLSYVVCPQCQVARTRHSCGTCWPCLPCVRRVLSWTRIKTFLSHVGIAEDTPGKATARPPGPRPHVAHAMPRDRTGGLNGALRLCCHLSTHPPEVQDAAMDAAELTPAALAQHRLSHGSGPLQQRLHPCSCSAKPNENTRAPEHVVCVLVLVRVCALQLLGRDSFGAREG